MKLLPALIALTLFCVHAQAERPGRPAPATENRAPANAPTPVGGAWISTGPDGERLEFTSGGTLLVDGTAMRYALRGRRLTIESDGGRLEATWRIDEDELVLELRPPTGERRIARYRRAARAADTLRAGAAKFTLPEAWVEGGREGDLVLLRPVEADVLEGFVIVAPFEIEAREARSSAVELLRGRLPALREELAGQGIAIQIAGAAVQQGRHAGLACAEVRLPARIGGLRPVTVWLSTVHTGASGAAVIALADPAQEGAFIATARRVLEGLAFEAEEDVERDVRAAGADLAGLEFGRSTFGSGSSHTVVYRFGRGGSLVRRSMFSSSIGGTDNESRGSYAVQGERVVLVVDGERTEGVLEKRGAHVTALRIGNAVYPRM